jgi:uncharacterized phage protein (TIGR01671 family)
MSKIKLRFWCNEHKWVEPGFNQPITAVFFNQYGELGVACPLCFKSRPMTLVQYTGLKDKNGVEIYGGDVIEKTQFNKNLRRNDKKAMQVRYLVKWNEQKHDNNDHNNKQLTDDPSSFSMEPGFRAKQITESNKFSYHSWSPFANCEVIGNIYENPDLLK